MGRNKASDIGNAHALFQTNKLCPLRSKGNQQAKGADDTVGKMSECFETKLPVLHLHQCIDCEKN